MRVDGVSVHVQESLYASFNGFREAGVVAGALRAVFAWRTGRRAVLCAGACLGGLVLLLALEGRQGRMGT